jgi:hypothetical protein
MKHKPNVTVYWLVLLLRILDVSSSDLGNQTALLTVVFVPRGISLYSLLESTKTTISHVFSVSLV